MSKPGSEGIEERISQDLLDYAKGRLSAQERVDVEALVAGNPAQQEELAFYQSLYSAFEGDRNGTQTGPDEMGWMRLSKAIAAEESPVGQTAIPQEGHKPAANSNQSYWRIAAMIAGVVALGQSIMLVNIGLDNQSNKPLYVSVAETEHAFDAKVIFRAEAVEADISALLKASNGDIVQGPSALGVYTVRFLDDEALKTGLESFIEASNVVESATH